MNYHQTNLLNELFDAIERNDLNKVEKIINQNVDLNDGDGLFTPLMYAAQKGRLSIAKKLVESGADVNIESTDGDFALFCAATTGHRKTFEYIKQATHPQLRKRAEALLKNQLVYKNGDITQLINAILDEDLNAVKNILNRDVDLNTVDPEGNSALKYAVLRGNTDIIQLILDEGANPNLGNLIKDKTPLMEVIGYLHELKVGQILINYHADINAIDKLGKTVLVHAIELSSVRFVQLLCRAGVNRKVKDKYGNAAIDIAAFRKEYKILKLLRQLERSEQGSKIDFFEASERGDTKVVKQLLQSGMHVDVRGYLGSTALIIASNKNHIDVVEMLIAAGSDPNISDENGNTALMNATLAGNLQVVKVLLDAGANTNQANKDGYTAKTYARHAGLTYGKIFEHHEILNLLENC